MLRFAFAVGIIYPLTWVSMFMGGHWLWFPLIAIVGSHVLMDNLTPRVRASFATIPASLGNLLLYAHVPCMLMTLLLLIMLGMPHGELAKAARWILAFNGGQFENLSVSQSTPRTVALYACSALIAGLMLSTNHIVGHELVHRRDQPFAMLMGRWLLAGNGDAQFSISHVYGHHMNVGTALDPATARRGESLYRFVIRSAIGQYGEAIALERQRLLRNGQGFFSLHNHFFSGLLMSLGLLVVGGLVGGGLAVMMLILSMVTAKFLFEVVNYIQHYGLVRCQGQKVEPRHSWDSDHRFATLVFYGLSRHSHHHTKPVLPYWKLESASNQAGPQLRHGYIAAMLIACAPPLWRRYTSTALADWDSRLANTEESALVRQLNTTT